MFENVFENQYLSHFFTTQPAIRVFELGIGYFQAAFLFLFGQDGRLGHHILPHNDNENALLGPFIVGLVSVLLLLFVDLFCWAGKCTLISVCGPFFVGLVSVLLLLFLDFFFVGLVNVLSLLFVNYFFKILLSKLWNPSIK